MKTKNKEANSYSIGEVAKILDVSVQTLRLYEERGLILIQKTEGNQRFYTEEDIDRIRCIRKAINEEKISMAGIQRIFSLIPCWQIVGCSVEHRSKCPSFKGHTSPCWSYDHQKNPCAKTDCRLCEVYKMSSDCGKIKNTIASIGTHN
jgi:MerR family transcriptional regulator/heat shock protein HspR